MKKLQLENYELRVQVEGQRFLIQKFDDLVAGERERHEKEKLALVDRLTDARHQVGSLEQQLLQIGAPKGTVRDAELSDVRDDAGREPRNQSGREQPHDNPGRHWQG
jgi:hypothetical protein